MDNERKNGKNQYANRKKHSYEYEDTRNAGSRSFRYEEEENDYVRDDSGKDGLRRRMRQRRNAIEIAVVIGFILLSLISVLIVRKCTASRNPAPSEDEESPVISSEEERTETDTESESESTEETPEETESETETAPPPTTSGTGFPAKMNLVPGVTVNPQGALWIPSWVTQDLLPVDGVHGREGTSLGSVKHIVIHYVGNTLSQAKDNRDYFAYQQDGRNVSSHFVVGLYGEIVQCVPVNEISHAQGVKNDSGRVNHNYDSISIETCHYNDAGQFTNETYQSLVKLTAFLLQQYGLPATGSSATDSSDDTGTILMHFHCSGKACPKYWADNPHFYDQFVADVQAYMAAHPNIAVEMP